LYQERRDVYRVFAFAIFLATLQGAVAAPTGASAAFNVFRGLAGIWAIQSGNRTLPIDMTYDVGSKGSIVTEQFGRELSVFYLDHDALLMTHFCNVGNQPRLRLKPNTPQGVFEFDMFDITNLADQNAPHVQQAIYHVIDSRRIELELIWRGRNTSAPESYTLSRKFSSGNQ
jgi:hypothetical protein